LIKEILLIDSKEKREKKLAEHTKVGKSYKKEIQDREKLIQDVETNLVREALKLPNKTHFDSPIGGEDKNEIIKVGGPEIRKDEWLKSHLEIAE
jgi:seryl-tRNA synthetase